MYFVQKELSNLSLDELIKELNPEKISFNLRWSEDIAYQKTVADLIVAHPLFEQLKDPLWSQQLALAYCEFGDYKKGGEFANRALALLENISDQFTKDVIAAKCHLILGIQYREPENKDKSLLLHKIGIAKCEDFKQEDSKLNLGLYSAIKAHHLRNMALTYLSAKQHKEAIACFDECYEVAKQSKRLEDYLLPIITYQGLSRVLLAEIQKNDSLLKEGLGFLKVAEEKYHAHPDVSTMMKSCEDYGSFAVHSAKAYLLNKNYDDAIRMYNVGYKIREHLTGQHRNRVADVFIGLARANQGLRKYWVAEELFNEAMNEQQGLPARDYKKEAEINEYIANLHKIINVSNPVRQFAQAKGVKTENVVATKNQFTI